jgi:hypothetical protein
MSGNDQLWDVVLFVLSFVFMAAAWVGFARLTMARIEREMKRDGLPRPCPWDGPGARILWYAHAISLPVGRFNRADNPLIDVPLVRKYATRADVIRGRLLLVFGYIFAIVAVVGGIMLEE